MRETGATEAKNKFGQMLEAAMLEPVAIGKKGRRVAVMMSMKEYQRLIDIEDRYWGEKALKAVQEGFVSEKDTKQWLESKLDVETVRK
jgi:prevent-host-death family protein